ncbi:hypothetical protein AC1031_006357 [Aphanomyces cochlioides]|nr:hypothetical protein AC1031_006357 [Aphanomyces cochlioides]
MKPSMNSRRSTDSQRWFRDINLQSDRELFPCGYAKSAKIVPAAVSRNTHRGSRNRQRQLHETITFINTAGISSIMADGGTLLEYSQNPEAATGEDDITWTFGGVNEDGSFYFINTKTGECVQNLPTTATPAAPSPEDPSALFVEHAAIYDSYEPAVADCVLDLVTSIEGHLKDWTRRRQRNAKSKRARKQAKTSTRALKPRKSPRTTSNQTPVRDENEQTTGAKDDSRRILHRQLTQKKQSEARQRANFKHEENHLRLHLTRVLLAQATNGLDVHGKIDFVAPPEHEIQVRFQERQQLAALFSQLLDNTVAASLSSLQALYALSTKSELESTVEARPGLLKLTTDGILQAFFLQLPQPLDVFRFVRFVEICEDVMDQVDRMKLAIESAKLGIVSADLVEWHQSMASVKTGLSSVCQLAAVNRLKQSLTTAMDICRSQLRHILHFHHATMSKSRDKASQATIRQQPIWQLNHKHVYIQVDRSEPLCCVHCRQARIRLEKLQRLELEAHHRARWGRYLAHALHEKEAAILQWHRGTQSVPAMPTMSMNATVAGILNDLVAAVAFLESFAMWQSLLFAENPLKASETADTLHTLTKSRDDLERQEFERACLFDVDELSADFAEAATIAVERPLIREQEAAHTELARLVRACIEPSMYIRRLQFQQLLAVRAPTDNMVLRVVESGETHETCILTTMRCSTLDQAAAIVACAKRLEKGAFPHVVAVKHAFSYMYQHFSTGGNLNECWPIVFVVTKDCERALQIPLRSLTPGEVLDIICTVSAALSALHSQGFVHLNVNRGNLYRAKDTGELQLGGFLAFKHPYTPADLNQSQKIALLLPPTVLPPEFAQVGSTAAAISDKTDMWALGCLLYSLLTGTTHQVLNDKPLSAIMKDIPLRYGPSLRSCLRMLLQPLPRHRPTATEIFHFLSCVSPDEKEPLAEPPQPKTPPATKKKSLPSLPTRSSSVIK